MTTRSHQAGGPESRAGLNLRDEARQAIGRLREGGWFKPEHELASAQGGRVALAGGRTVINLASNNYLGLADDPRLVEIAKQAIERWGLGLASVRFISGTQTIHKELEADVSDFLDTEATILYGSCFDANAGLFEVLLDENDAVISDELNHASIIDGIRLCRAKRLRYRNGDMEELRDRLEAAAPARRRMIVTDGVFSMDGHLAPLHEICELADRHDAVVVVDDSHAVGVVGPSGRGTPARYGVHDRVDLVTGTFGKALGGASGGYTSGRKEIVELLRQRSRPYLFSNSLAPAIVAVSRAAIELARGDGDRRARLWANTEWFRGAMAFAGLDIVPGEHPIVPIVLGDARRASRVSADLLESGVLAPAFSYPVVPEGKARIRAQVSAAHTDDDLRRVVEAFVAAAGGRQQA